MTEYKLKLSEWVGIDLGTTNTVAAIYKGGLGNQQPGSVEVLYVVECELFNENNFNFNNVF